MKMKLSPSNHYHEHQALPREGQNSCDEVRNPQNIRLAHQHLQGVLSRAKQGRMIAVHDNLHGRAFEQKVPFIMYSMQGALLTQAPLPGPWDTSTPAQDNGQ